MKLSGHKQIATRFIAILLLMLPYLLFAQKRQVPTKPQSLHASKPVAMQEENKILVEKFDPEDKCVSVEADASDTGPDPFSSCARSVFQKQLAHFDTPNGTQNNKAAADLLKKCLVENPGKETLLIGHGQPGRIWTGDGQTNPPGKEQSLVAGHPDLGLDFRDLNTPQLTLLGCWVGATPDSETPAGQALVNEIASKSRRVRAQNSVVFCSTVKDKEGLYLDAAPERVWVVDTLGMASSTQTSSKPTPQLLKTIVKPACICVKDQDNMCGESVDLRPQGAKFPLDKVQLTGYAPVRESRDFSVQRSLESLLDHNLHEQYFHLLLKSTEDLIDQIGFCSPSQPGVPDLESTGNFTLKINGKSRQFDVLGDVMVRDHDHPEELYWMRNGAFQQFHINVQTRWLQILQQQIELRSTQKNRAKSQK